MIIPPIQVILIVENIWCLYRNYSLFGKMYQKLIILRTFVEITIIIESFWFRSKINITRNGTHVFYYDALNAFSLIVLVSTIYHASSFKKLLIKFNTYQSYFPADQIYLKKRQRKQAILKYIFIIYNCLQLSAEFVFTYFDDEFEFEFIYVFMYYLFEVNTYACFQRLVSEFAAVNGFLFVIAEQIHCIIRSVNEQIEVGSKKLKLRQNVCNKIEVQLLDKWSEAYITVEKITQLFGVIFGMQITVQILIVISFYIIMLYLLTTLTIEGKLTSAVVILYFIYTMQFLTTITAVAYAAQRAQNTADTLRRRLCVLLIQSQGCEKNYKATRDLLRQVCTYPIQTKAYGSITVNMSLLPSCVAFCTAYTVTTLQFNNII